MKCLPEQSLKGSLYGDLVGVAQVFEGEPETPVEANIHRDSSITGHFFLAGFSYLAIHQARDSTLQDAATECHQGRFLAHSGVWSAALASLHERQDLLMSDALSLP